ncbi:glycosyl transferase family protein [Photobacterium phosphoreum]|uniref:glycosyl transferase family protein n=1 Tax=Photobacterium phosphoreum TaxID=659 RepID=UPI0022B77A0D|nr:glycosyl transferase family protein [Photobacterium phosphoreum]MCD9505344.1 phage adsorption protein NrfB [Photobacterium phosphoreum]
MLFDFFINYLYVLKYISLVLMFILAIFGIDDLFIDVYFWGRKLWRKVTIYRHYDRMSVDQLLVKSEQPIAIMVPAWQEHGVIDKMAHLAAIGLDYENYQIFVGTYPNDPQTQADVDNVCAQFSHVHKVVCAQPGPTSKADCLNNIIASIIEFEKKAKIEFAGFVLHDSEDVISAMELRLFNYLLPRKDLVQLPVYPYARKWYQMTPSHYLDEFAELHGKDVIVREALAGQVPSAGVGTCFSRKAILRLSIEGDGLPFDVQSLTEDYDIGFRLKQWGMEEIFVRFPVMGEEHITLREHHFGVSKREGNVVCVREYFPTTFNTAVRQKTRWIIGIVFQGMKNHKWTNDWRINYFLWRDRRGAMSNLGGFLAMLLLFQMVGLTLYSAVVPDSYHFLSLLSDDPIVEVLLYINLILFFNRSFQRAYFVTQYYGFWQGFLSFPRMIWGNIINFFANVRAIRQVLEQGDPRRIAWDKTTHDFPIIDETIRRIPLGKILIEKGLITEKELEDALLSKPSNMLLGTHLVMNHYVTNDQLTAAIAKQVDAEYLPCDPFDLDADVIKRLPKQLALKYSVLPIKYEMGMLILGSNKRLNPVVINVIKRQLQCDVSWVIITNGAVMLGLRYWYLNDKDINPTIKLDQAVVDKQLSLSDRQYVIDQYYASRMQLGDYLLALKLIEPTVLNQAVLAFSRTSDILFGDFLVSHQYVQSQAIDAAITLKNKQEVSIDRLIQIREVILND